MQQRISKLNQNRIWGRSSSINNILLEPFSQSESIYSSELIFTAIVRFCSLENIPLELIIIHEIYFVKMQVPRYKIHTFTDHIILSMPETIEHRIIRSKSIHLDSIRDKTSELSMETINTEGNERTAYLLPENFYKPAPDEIRPYQATILPELLFGLVQTVNCSRRRL